MKTQSRNIEIDNLRAIAIIGTLFAHIGGMFLTMPHFLNSIFKYITGVEGVILFFAISGYVISASFIPKLDSKNFLYDQIKIIHAFFVRRFFRIIIPTSFWVVVMILLVSFGLQWGIIETIFSGIATLFGIENLYILITHPIHNRFFIYWSLSLEMQFYCLLPFFLALLKNKWGRLFGLGLFIILLQFLPGNLHGQLRGECLIMGVMVYLLFHDFKWLDNIHSYFKKKRLILKLIGFSLIIFLFTCYGALWSVTNALPFPFIYGIKLNFFWTLLVAIAALKLDIIIFPSYIKLAMNWLGSRSFTLYLAHYPMMYLTHIIAIKLTKNHIYAFNHPLAITVFWLTSLAVAVEISYKMIEMPMTALGRKLAKQIENKSAVSNRSKIDQAEKLTVDYI